MEHFENFIRDVYEKMSHPNWGVFEKQKEHNNFTFQEICDDRFDGDLDEALVFFRYELNTWVWFSDFVNTCDIDIDDIQLYLENLSIPDLKDILGLTEYSLK